MEKDLLIFRGDSFLMEFGAFEESPFAKKISNILNKECGSVKDTHYPHRVINHWDNLGLLLKRKGEDKKWRKFTALDLFWIFVAIELREFGFSLDKIKKTKKSIFSTFQYKDDQRLIEYYIALSMFRNTDCVVIVTPSGHAELATIDQLIDSEFVGSVGSHIIINFNHILGKVFPKNQFDNIKNLPDSISDEELALLMDVRSYNYDSIKIKFKNDNTKIIEKSRRHNNLEKLKTVEVIKKLLAQNDYQTIELQQAGGNITSIKQTSRKIL